MYVCVCVYLYICVYIYIYIYIYIYKTVYTFLNVYLFIFGSESLARVLSYLRGLGIKQFENLCFIGQLIGDQRMCQYVDKKPHDPPVQGHLLNPQITGNTINAS